jgi:hypothetical protein
VDVAVAAAEAGRHSVMKEAGVGKTPVTILMMTTMMMRYLKIVILFVFKQTEFVEYRYRYIMPVPVYRVPGKEAYINQIHEHKNKQGKH